MPFVEPTIPVVTPNAEDSGLPIPIAGGLIGQLLQRAVDSTYFKLDTYVVGTDTPAAVAIPNNKGYQKATIVIEQQVSTGGICARYWLDGRWPTVTTGLPLVDKQVINVTCAEDLQNIRLVSTDGNEHVIQVQFFN